MRLKAVWLTIAALSLPLMAAVPLSQAASRFWKPEVTQAANVTFNLLKDKSLQPVLRAHRSRALRSLHRPIAFTPSAKLISYSLTQRLSLNRHLPSAFQKWSSTSRTTNITLLVTAHNDSLSLNPGEHHYLPQATLQYQKCWLKPSEFEFTQELSRFNQQPSVAFNQQTENYEIAAQEFKAFLNSFRIAN